MTGAIVERDAAGIAGSDAFRDEVAVPCQPVVLRGLTRDWPLTKAGLAGAGALAAYLARFDRGTVLDAFVGPPAIGGRYYYSDDLTGFNFERRQMTLAEALVALAAPRAPQDPTLYVGSLPMAHHLPGLAAENPIALPGCPPDAGRIWLGHPSRVSTHYDMLDNVACVAAGQRRFTLYAPEFTRDLYVGPIDHTMAGQPVSLAASAAPDDPRFPRFHAIADRALVAELEPGDAIYVPKLWWHQVESTAPMNALVNYWWDPFASGPDAPHTTMLLAMIAIAERPEGERAAWRTFFDHYVFRPDGHPLAYLPAERHGILGPLRTNYGRIRAYVMQMLRNA